MAPISDEISLRTISRANSTSVHGNISPLHQAATPDSSVQPHNHLDAQEQDLPENVGNPDDESEMQPSLSSVSTSSNPASLGQENNRRFDPFRRTTHWKTTGMIIGFNFAAFLSALGHYFLFRNLDRQLTETSYLTQPHVSAVSILLTTIFNAALTASIGTSFAQHLWLVLRGNPMPIDTIERFFVLRNNIFALCDLRSTWRSPTLIAMALSVWCLGLATIYPPGALIVSIEPYTSTDKLEMAVMNPSIPRDLDFAGADSFPTLALDGFGLEGDRFIIVNNKTSQVSQGARTLAYHGPRPALRSIAQSIIIDNHVFNLPKHPGENSTYKLQFRGPQLRCNSSQYGNTISLKQTESEWYPITDFISKWLTDSLSLSVQHRNISNYSIPHDDRNTTTIRAYLETTEHACIPKSVLYDVNVTFPRGVQKLRYHLSDERDVRKKWHDPDSASYEPGPLISSDLRVTTSADLQASEHWNQKVRNALPAFNEWAILDALGSLLEVVSTKAWWGPYEAYGPFDCQVTARDNKTTTEECGHWEENFSPACPTNGPNSSFPLQGTIFQTARFDPKSLDSCYDPTTEVNITEELLNSALTNITLSAISLGLWQETIPVNITRYQSTYSFANPLNFILPYSICFLAASIFAGIAIYSLLRNGTPAADGGFLQIMTTTRGNTEMERLVLRHDLTKMDKLPMELRRLKVRYGELVGSDVPGFEGRAGFGTAQETISLRKRK